MKTTNKKTFYGEAGATFLVLWLNGPGETPWREWARERLEVFNGPPDSDAEARGRIASLIRQVKQFTEMAGELYARERIEANDRDFQLFRGLHELINKGLSRYQAFPMILQNPLVKGKDGYLKAHFQGRAPYEWGTGMSGSTALLQEIKAVTLLQQAEKEGWLHQVRECRICGRWFFARKNASQHCDAKCRKKDYQSTEKYKKRRHQYYQASVNRSIRGKKRASNRPRRSK
jgi:hypothetical protein